MSFNNPNDPFINQREFAYPGTEVHDPANWMGSDFQGRDDWLYHLSDQDIAELHACVKPYDQPDTDLIPLDRSAFALPTFGETLKQIRQELLYGRGFINIRGLPLDDFGKRGAGIAFWAISQHLGDGVWSQNWKGHVFGHVTDIGQSKSNPNQRGPYSSEALPYHCDCTDIVGLLCVETAKSGGESSLASSVAVHNAILRDHPDLLTVLYGSYARDRRDEIPPGMDPWYHLPVFNFQDGYFAANIEPTYMKSTHRFDEIDEMTAAQKEALALVQHLAEEYSFNMGFAKGDMQFLNNHIIFHSRRAFEDYPDTERKRHLMRIWIKALDGRPLAPDFYARHGKPGEVDRPGGIVGPDTVLNAPLERQ